MAFTLEMRTTIYRDVINDTIARRSATHPIISPIGLVPPASLNLNRQIKQEAERVFFTITSLATHGRMGIEGMPHRLLRQVLNITAIYELGIRGGLVDYQGWPSMDPAQLRWQLASLPSLRTVRLHFAVLVYVPPRALVEEEMVRRMVFLKMWCQLMAYPAMNRRSGNGLGVLLELWDWPGRPGTRASCAGWVRIGDLALDFQQIGMLAASLQFRRDH